MGAKEINLIPKNQRLMIEMLVISGQSYNLTKLFFVDMVTQAYFLGLCALPVLACALPDLQAPCSYYGKKKINKQIFFFFFSPL